MKELDRMIAVLRELSKILDEIVPKLEKFKSLVNVSDK